MPSIFDNRTYRARSRSTDLVSFAVTVKETNLLVQAETDLVREAYAAVYDARAAVEVYREAHDDFARSLVPVPDDDLAPPVVRQMIRGSRLAGVGPMAAVAGAIAQFVAEKLASLSPEVIVENGGDIFMRSVKTRVVALLPEGDETPVGIEIADAAGGIGVSSSSALIGQSLSMGRSSLATVVARSGALSDAAATALGNLVSAARDIEPSLGEITAIPGVIGAVVVIGGKIGVKGGLKLVALSG
jgi:ApbE superfamily uncharacterized protein (UPF0280 family)